MESYLTLLVLLVVCTKYIDCLHCFDCPHVPENSDCDIVTRCNKDESCYIERSARGNSTEYSLGCMPIQSCPDEHQFTMVGRSVTSHCMKCCSRDGCNKQYCEPQHPTGISAPKPTQGSCIDAPLQNCSTLASVVDICSTPHRAKDICRKYCGLCGMVDGSLGQWHGWSTCSTTCGLGVESRTRQCNDPAPAHGGYDCPGDRTQSRSCFQRACPVHGGWSVWLQWEHCPVSCGSGLKKRHRTCTNPPPSFDGHSCIGDPVEYDLCHGSDCGNQSTTSTPSTTVSNCGNVLVDCDIANKTLGVCNNFEAARKTCPKFCGICGIVDGVWAAWSPWAACSKSCGQGTTTRTRTCSDPPPQNGGKTCAGNNTETKQCTLRACPVHGGWGIWAHWSTCSSTCGKGITRRTRVCDNPRPQLLGNFCFGDSTEYGMCLIKQCPVDGGWTDWSFWSSCSVTCGNGHTIRQRSCSNPTPRNGGLTCAGPRMEQQKCNLTHCSVDGGWTDWSIWSKCSVTCGNGHATRQRYCVKPPPTNGGVTCAVPRTEQSTCNIANCQGVMSAFTVANPQAGVTSGTIRFPHVITNIGGHYNTTTGIFTCKYPGIYVFELHIIKSRGSNEAECAIRKNQNHVLVEAWTNPDRNSDDGNFGSTNSIVIHLIHGDTIDLGYCTSAASMYTGGDWGTSFSGFLLRAD